MPRRLFLSDRALRFGRGQLFGVDDRLVDGAAGRTEGRKLGIGALALHHIDGRDRLAADLVGGRALDDRPVHAPGLAALLLDILEAAIDDRVDRVKLSLDKPLRRCPPVAAIPASVPLASVPLASVSLATVPWPPATLGAAVAPAALAGHPALGLALLRRGARSGRIGRSAAS